MTDFGNLALVEEREETEGGNVVVKLPGVKKGDLSARSVKPEVSTLANRSSSSSILSYACV